MMTLCLRRHSSHWFSSPVQRYRGVIGRADHYSRHFSVYISLQSKQTPDFSSGFTRSYDPTLESGRGPMFRKVNFGVPQFYPRDLKRRVDDYVVGQERAKKTICSAIFNHYQNLRRRRQHEQEDKEKHEKLLRQRFARDRELSQRRWDTLPAEDEAPGQSPSARQIPDLCVPETSSAAQIFKPEDPAVSEHIKIDKSNILVIGPTGVGKTYILETLSKKIQVPLTICDCNSLTQAGYIGQDVESCIERLLIEANYDVKATEHGIVVLDEFDKLARRETTTGRDVSGEGVQQALLKLVEGTKVTINVKDNRSSRAATPIPTNYNVSGAPTTSVPVSSPPGKVDQYTVDTTNILFVFCGAFVGLDKIILQRVTKPAMGFGGDIQSRHTGPGNAYTLPPEIYSHLAHYSPQSAPSFTPIDLVTSEDLQRFGFIPEIIGRLHNICALSPLSQEDLYRILTEPRNSLVAQYSALFETYPSQLYFTEKALAAIAERALAADTGARGLKMEMERVLAEPMFDAPTPYVLITEACVKGFEKAAYWGKDGRHELSRRLEEEQLDSHNPQHSLERLKQADEGSG
ncbi:atp-dependent clp protease atp-binding subunit [Trichoderma arundinaceum]|uniref:Atp-dependent clp protease atp-binding subunit n=1 Tax=Trichoderma arundinaceum TaxID=490622 RepID=A0A395NXR9_TRIAR|nr:atp-dependent clp protease atp-binding subunit [Trichoderma arundinaceum]